MAPAAAFLALVAWRTQRGAPQRRCAASRRTAAASGVRACVIIPGVDMASRAAALAARDAAEAEEEEAVELGDFSKDVPILNMLALTGRLGGDPTLRQVGRNGTPLCTFSLAVNSTRIGKGGARHTSWYRVNVWGARGESAAQMLRKGMRVGVHGGVNVDEYTDKAGNKRTSVTLTAKSFEILQSRREFGDDAGGGGGGAPTYYSSRMRARPGADGGDDKPMSSSPMGGVGGSAGGTDDPF